MIKQKLNLVFFLMIHWAKKPSKIDHYLRNFANLQLILFIEKILISILILDTTVKQMCLYKTNLFPHLCRIITQLVCIKRSYQNL